MQINHHQQFSLLSQSDLVRHMKLNNAGESQTEGNVIFIKKFIDPITRYFFKYFIDVG